MWSIIEIILFIIKHIPDLISIINQIIDLFKKMNPEEKKEFIWHLKRKDRDKVIDIINQKCKGGVCEA